MPFKDANRRNLADKMGQRGKRRMPSSPIKKRTININGHKTSISLEDDFWNSLKQIAHERGESLRHLTAIINAKRKFANLSSALRLFVLEYYTKRVDPLEQQEMPVAKRRKRR